MNKQPKTIVFGARQSCTWGIRRGGDRTAKIRAAENKAARSAILEGRRQIAIPTRATVRGIVLAWPQLKIYSLEAKPGVER